MRVNGGDPIESGDEFPVGVEIYVKATAAENHLFSAWNITGAEVDDTTGEVTFDMPANDIEIGAEFVIDPAIDWVLIGGLKWAKSNVAAPGTFAEKPEDYGMYYQFGKTVGWVGATPTPSDGIFYLATGANAGWGGPGAPVNNPYGQGPCPQNYVVPTAAQYEALVAATTQTVEPLNGVNGVVVAEGDVSIFFPFAGHDASGQQPTGALANAGEGGVYWTGDFVSYSGTPGPPPFAKGVNTGNTDTPFVAANYPRNGILPVRCVMVQQ